MPIVNPTAAALVDDISDGGHRLTRAISRGRLRSVWDGDPVVRAWMADELRRRYPQLQT